MATSKMLVFFKKACFLELMRLSKLKNISLPLFNKKAHLIAFYMRSRFNEENLFLVNRNYTYNRIAPVGIVLFYFQTNIL